MDIIFAITAGATIGIALYKISLTIGEFIVTNTDETE
jgi:hypothetical protein